MNDNLGSTWNKFFEHRSKPLWERFPGVYRALVVETNDPLRMFRIQFKCPELHDWDMKDSECQWAVPSFDLGSRGHGRWSHPCKGDWVWIQFEKGYPTAAVWTGFATPTRRKFYALPSIYGKTPVPVNENGTQLSAPEDYDPKYMPADSRPMSHGWQDRYGNLDISSSVGFYPIEHQQQAGVSGSDPVQSSQLDSGPAAPKQNDPDLKYMARVSKYGNMLLLADQGYSWKKGDGVGEFHGDFEKDGQFEQRRWLYLQKLVNEGQPKSSAKFGDQRRTELKSRYGSRLEIRDVGWAQSGPIPSKTRQGEYGEPTRLSAESSNDFRWVKLRTKGGWLFQAYDKGFHPSEDKFVKRKLLDECGHRSEREDKHWAGKDARWLRMVGRHGFKFVIDERGSDPKDAESKELPRGNGVLIKGRRSPGANMKPKKGNPRGFYFEFNENDALNHLTMGSPLGQVVELNDRYEYAMIAATLGKGYTPKWRKLKENEFLLEPGRARDPEAKSHHLILDHENEYVRLKTRAGGGSKPDHVVNPTGVPRGGLNQGLEARDGSNGMGPWVEVVDSEGRGVWFSKTMSLGVWRGKQDSEMFQWFVDGEGQQHIVIYNGGGTESRVKIYCQGDVEVKSEGKMFLDSGRDMHIKSGGDINLDAASTINLKANLVNVDGSGAKMNFQGTIKYDPILELGAQAAGGATPAQRPEKPQAVSPDDRGATYNSPFEKCPVQEVEHRIGGGK